MLIMVNVPLSAQPTLKHTVDVGETLNSIAQRYGTTEARIIELNPDAADFIYVGMELVIPIASPANSAENMENSADKKDSVSFATEIASSMSLGQTNRFSQENPGNAGEVGSKNDDRKWDFYEVQFMATSFKSVKASGMYGLGVIALPLEVAPDWVIGGHFSLLVNFGLASKGWESFVAMFGPALGYCFTPSVFISAPLDVVCNSIVGSNAKLLEQIGAEDTSWGLALSPSVYIGRKFGVFLDPVFSISFVKNAEVVCGFRAGIFF